MDHSGGVERGSDLEGRGRGEGGGREREGVRERREGRRERDGRDRERGRGRGRGRGREGEGGREERREEREGGTEGEIENSRDPQHPLITILTRFPGDTDRHCSIPSSIHLTSDSDTPNKMVPLAAAEGDYCVDPVITSTNY